MSKLQSLMRCLVLAAVAALGWTLGEVFRSSDPSFPLPMTSTSPMAITPEAAILSQLAQGGTWVFQGQPWEISSIDVQRSDLEVKLGTPPGNPSVEDVDPRTERLIFDILKSLDPQVKLEGSSLHYVARKAGYQVHAFVAPDVGKPRLHVVRFAADGVTAVTRLVEVRPRARVAPTTRPIEPRLDLDCPVLLSRLDAGGVRIFDILDCAGGIPAMIPRWKAAGWQVETPDWAPKDRNYQLCRKGEVGYLVWEEQEPGHERAGIFVSKVP